MSGQFTEMAVTLSKLGSYESFGKGGVMVLRGMVGGKVEVFRFGLIPAYSEHNVKVLYKQGWSQYWIAQLYGKNAGSISKLLKGRTSQVHRLFNEHTFIGDRYEHVNP